MIKNFEKNNYINAELEELRRELDNLVIKKDNTDDEILKLSRKIDKIILRYYKMQQAERGGNIA